MNKLLAVIVMSIPITAMAHGPAYGYYLMWWHLGLIVFVLGFALFGQCPIRQRFISIAGLVFGTVIAWVTLGNLDFGQISLLSKVLDVVIVLGPIAGFLMGYYFARAKSQAI